MLQPAHTLPPPFSPIPSKHSMDYGAQFDAERSSFCHCSLGQKICPLLQGPEELPFSHIPQSLLRAAGPSAPQRIQTQTSGGTGRSLPCAQTHEFWITLMAKEHRALLPSTSIPCCAGDSALGPSRIRWGTLGCSAPLGSHLHSPVHPMRL